MAQTVVQSQIVALSGGSNPKTVTLTGVANGNAIEVRAALYEASVAATLTVTDGANTYNLAGSASSIPTGGGQNVTAQVYHAENVIGGNRTVSLLFGGGSGGRYGWVWVGEIAGRATSGALDSAATGTNYGNSAAPSVSGGGSTTQAGCMIVGVLSADGSASNLGIDAANGSSLTWTNRILKQDSNAEMGMSGDDAPASSTLTPTVNWGTLGSSQKWAAVIVAFKDAGGGPIEEDITESAEAGDSYDAEARAVATRSEGAQAGATAAAEARATATFTEGAEAGDAYAATVVQSGAVSEGAEAGDQQGAEARATTTISEGAVADATFDATIRQADDISEGAEAGSSFAAKARAGAGITEGAEAGDSYIGETPESAVISEHAEAGSTFEAAARATATRTEAAEAGDAYAVKARASAGISEGAEAGDEYAEASGATISEGAAAGDAYAAVARAVAAVVAGAKAGDAYAAQGGQPIAPLDDGVLAPKFAGFPNVVRRWVGDEKPQKKRRKKAEAEPAPVARGPAGLALGIGDVDTAPEPATIIPSRVAPGAADSHKVGLAGSTPVPASNTREGARPAARPPDTAPEVPASAAAEAPQNQPPPWGQELVAAAEALRVMAAEVTSLRAQIDAQDANINALADMLALTMRQLQGLPPAIERTVRASEQRLRREIEGAVTAVASLGS